MIEPAPNSTDNEKLNEVIDAVNELAKVAHSPKDVTDRLNAIDMRIDAIVNRLNARAI